VSWTMTHIAIICALQGISGKRPLPRTRSFDDQHSRKLLLPNLFCALRLIY
jgi:hypothetical protein